MLYADSSFLISGYLRDAHIDDFLRRMTARPAIWVTPLHPAEIAHTIYLHVFYKKLSEKEAARAYAQFQDDCAAHLWELTELPPRIWLRAIALARRHSPALGVRTLDSLHVACALELGAQRFWTFDDRQARLAQAAGLNTAA